MGRIRTFKTKLLLLVLIVLPTAALSFVVFSKREIESALYHREQEASKNVLYLVLQTIENQYQDFIDHKRTVLEMRKEAMKALSRVAISTIDDFYERFRKGLLSEYEAKQQALERVKTFRYGSDDYFFVYDTDYTAISHPDPLFMGRKLRDYTDAKGLFVIQELMRASREQGGGFVPYWWKRLADPDEEPVRKIGYAIFYPRWQWMIGTGLYIDDLDAEYQRKLNAIAAQLKSSFAKIKAETGGSLFLFNGKKELIIPPIGSGDERPHLEEFMKASRTPDQPFRYLLQSAGTNPTEVWRQAYVVYFEPLDWYVVGAFDEADLEKPGKILVRKAIVFTVVALMIGLALAYIIAAKVSRPLSQLAGYAKNLPSREFRSEPDPAVEGLSRRGDEVGRLAEAFLFMQKMLQEYLDHLKKTTAAKERIESELNIAHEIQMSMVPKTFPAFPERSEFDIFATLVPAKEVGGDLYDFFFIDDDHLCFAVGDVSDKGVPASLFMAVTKTLFRATASNCGTPGEILARLNAEICRDNESCMFVTFFCGILDVRTGQVDYSNGGHNLPYYLHHDGVSPLKNAGGGALGLVEQSPYASGRMVLAPGEALLLYTDGVTEAIDLSKTLYSDQRLEQFLETNRGSAPRQIIGDLVSDVRHFAGEAPQSDDITVLALLYLGTTEKMREELETKLHNKLSELRRFNQTLMEFGQHHGLAPTVVHDLNLSLEEILTNIISYGYTDSQEHEIRVRLSVRPGEIKAEVEDDGQPFNPLAAPEPHTAKALEERTIGGLGIHLVRTLMDGLEYKRQADRNILTIKKKT
ncbi:MAG TPA: SpoIIE family protein phosphatase [Candidatus Binatia bacterium]